MYLVEKNKFYNPVASNYDSKFRNCKKVNSSTTFKNNNNNFFMVKNNNNMDRLGYKCN